jgi:hypothetical protein
MEEFANLFSFYVVVQPFNILVMVIGILLWRHQVLPGLAATGLHSSSLDLFHVADIGDYHVVPHHWGALRGAITRCFFKQSLVGGDHLRRQLSWREARRAASPLPSHLRSWRSFRRHRDCCLLRRWLQLRARWPSKNSGLFLAFAASRHEQGRRLRRWP